MNPTIATDAFDNAVGRNAENKPRDSGNIFLIGMMGAGKTTIAKLVGGLLEKAVYDCDREIQKRTGVSIPVIFEIEGECGFRKRETEMLAELVKSRNIVLATGGRGSAEPGKPGDAPGQRDCGLFASDHR